MAASDDASTRSYAPYSGVRIGAALLASSGHIYAGSNVENASYGLTICAERAAAVAAVNAGDTSFLILAVSSPDVESLVPCGACLQFLAEFSQDLKIVLKSRSGRLSSVRMRQLLPRPFEKDR